MKNTIYFLLIIAQLGYSQNIDNVKAIPMPDSSELVFHNIPFVNIEIYGVQTRKTFDYETTIKSIETIQEILVSFGFTNKESVEYLEILDNSEFVKLFENIDRNEKRINIKLSKLSEQYKERYVCFVLQYGATSTPKLAQAKHKGNITDKTNAYFSSSHIYEINITNISQFLFIVFDNNTQDIVYLDLSERVNLKDENIFSQKITKENLTKLKRRLKKNIIKNLRKKACAF